MGAAIRTGLDYARREGYDIAVILAGNDKDDPSEIPRLLDPICDDHCAMVIGSRYLAGGAFGGDMPLYRKWATRLHARLLGWFCGRKTHREQPTASARCGWMCSTMSESDCISRGSTATGWRSTCSGRY